MNKQIDIVKRLPTLEIMKYINELLKELQSRNCYVPKMPAVVEAEDSDMKAIVLPVMIREE